MVNPPRVNGLSRPITFLSHLSAVSITARRRFDGTFLFWTYQEPAYTVLYHKRILLSIVFPNSRSKILRMGSNRLHVAGTPVKIRSMGIIELLVIAFGLAADAFAVSACLGMSAHRLTPARALIPALYFGFFQAGMPLAGYFAGAQFSGHIRTLDHWIAFALLAFIGGKMVWGSFRQEPCPPDIYLSPRKMLPLALATSVDALAVGVSFAFLPDVNILHAVLSIGVITFALSILGAVIGRAFGLRLKTAAERMGGFVLILMGVKILIEHLAG